MVDPLDAIRYEIALTHVPFIGPKRTDKLLQAFGGAEGAWRASEAQLAKVLDSRSLGSMVKARRGLDIDGALSRIRRIGAEVILSSDERYPDQLRQIPSAPRLLYVLGDGALLSRPSVAVVGTRRSSAYGRRAARVLAGDLAAAGVSVVSGLALGVDTAAHRGALDEDGPTVAVLGCGVDIAYPQRNAGLRSEVAQRGALVSEYPPGTPPTAGNFPARNRIVSGLSIATVVVEAGVKSGALITAKCALDQGRDVFAVPGSIFSQGHAGANGLLAAGAAPALSAQDVLDLLELSHLAVDARSQRPAAHSELEAGILRELASEPVHIDELGRRAGLSTVEIARTLAVMELRGLVENTGGMRWIALA